MPLDKKTLESFGLEERDWISEAHNPCLGCPEYRECFIAIANNREEDRHDRKCKPETAQAGE